MHRHYESKQIVEDYIKYRPPYRCDVAAKIIEYVKIQHPPTSSNNDKLGFMVDVGCGAGQSTMMFSPYFDKILGIDPSPNQVKNATRDGTCANIEFMEGFAEDIQVPDQSVDVVVSGAAIHWFNFPSFIKEADRILKPGGCLALFGYWTPIVTPLFGKRSGIMCDEVTNLLADYLLEAAELGNRYENVRYVQEKYETQYQAIPYQTKVRKEVIQKTLTNFNQLIGYMRPMDSFDTKPEAVDQLEKEIRRIWNVVDKKGEEIPLEFKQEIFILLATKN